MKYGAIPNYVEVATSLPARGAWIEIIPLLPYTLSLRIVLNEANVDGNINFDDREMLLEWKMSGCKQTYLSKETLMSWCEVKEYRKSGGGSH